MANSENIINFRKIPSWISKEKVVNQSWYNEMNLAGTAPEIPVPEDDIKIRNLFTELSVACIQKDETKVYDCLTKLGFSEKMRVQILIDNLIGDRANFAISNLKKFSFWILRSLEYVERVIYLSCSLESEIWDDEQLIAKIDHKIKKENKQFRIFLKPAMLGQGYRDSQLFKYYFANISHTQFMNNFRIYVNRTMTPFIHFLLIDKRGAILEAIRQRQDLNRYISIFCAKKPEYQLIINLLKLQSGLMKASLNTTLVNSPEDFELVSETAEIPLPNLERNGYQSRWAKGSLPENDRSPFDWIDSALKNQYPDILVTSESEEWKQRKIIWEKSRAFEKGYFKEGKLLTNYFDKMF